MNIEFSVGFGKDAARQPDGSPDAVLFVGNFSGAKTEDTDSAPIRHMFRFDLHDVDAAIGKVAPTLILDDSASVALADLDDFHPDRLARRIPAFSTFHELKQSLRDPGKADAAVLICRELLGPGATEAPVDSGTKAAVDAPAGDSSGDDMFSRLLGKPAGKSAPESAQVKSAMERILAQATREDPAPPQASQESVAMEAGLENLMASAMRELLTSEPFQALESAWRSVQWFGERLETGDEIATWLVDTGASPAAAWAPAVAARVVQEIGSVGTIVLLDEFDDSQESLESLRQVTALANQLRASIFTGASAGLAGLAVDPADIVAADRSHMTENTAEWWDRLRAEPGAERVALAFPHILMRQPYGRRSDPVEAFDFEELEARPPHSAFLWGNPAIAIALMSLTDEVRLDDLPMVVYDDGSGQAIKPVSEIYLAESAIDEMLRRGIVPLTGNRGGTDIRAPRLQSISARPAAI